MNVKGKIFRFFLTFVCFSCFHYTLLRVKEVTTLQSDVIRSEVNKPVERKWPTRFMQRQVSQEHSSKQQSVVCYKPVFLVIVVFTAPEKLDLRSSIRNTWAKVDHDVDPNVRNLGMGRYESSELVKTVFLLGQAKEKTLQDLVTTEAKHYGDVVMGQFLDSYSNLTLKAMLGFNWTYRHCKFDYLLKTDDDVFVNIYGLIGWLWQLPRKNLYTGRCYFNSGVVREMGNKWRVSKEQFPRNVYPPYCLGMGYILSSDVFHNMMEILPSQPFFVFEDVFVGLMMEQLHIKPTDNSRLFLIRGDYPQNICTIKDMILSHYANANQMLELHLKFLKVNMCN